MIRQQGQPPHFQTMAAQHVQTFPSSHVPNADRLVGAGGGFGRILQDSGVIAIFRGSRPADNRGQVWSSDRAGGR